MKKVNSAKNANKDNGGFITWRASDLKPLIDRTAKYRRMSRSAWLAKVVKEALEREALEIGSKFA